MIEDNVRILDYLNEIRLKLLTVNLLELLVIRRDLNDFGNNFVQKLHLILLHFLEILMIIIFFAVSMTDDR